MSRKRTEPDEALGPAVDGLDLISWEPVLPVAEEEHSVPEELEASLEFDEPVALIIGDTPESRAVAELASRCGFLVEAAMPGEGKEGEVPGFPGVIKYLGDLEDVVARCGIGRQYFVCIFLEDVLACELVLSQCLASDASYLGVACDLQKKEEIFAALKEDGEPDAELCAIAAPMGLNIGAEGPEQQAVAILAELLAARAGKLKRLRHSRHDFG